jgi:hypothetical protein
MKRIITVLRESEAMAVRKAVCMAGAERVVIVPMPQRLCATDQKNWHFEQPAAQSEVRIRLEVTVSDIHYGGIVSAIQRVAQAAKIILDSHLDMLPMHAAPT